MLTASNCKILAFLALVSLIMCTMRAASALSLFGGGSTSDNKLQASGGVDAGDAGSVKLSTNLSGSMGGGMGGGMNGGMNGAMDGGMKQSQSAQQSSQFDPTNMQQLMEFGMNPMGSTMKYLLPNTFSGISSDLSNGMNMMSNTAQKGYSHFNSMMPQMGGSSGFQGMFNTDGFFRNRYTDMLQQRLQQSEATVRQLYQMMQNPEQMCRQLMQQTQNGFDQAQKTMNDQQQSLSSSASSMMNTIGNSRPGSFLMGKK